MCRDLGFALLLQYFVYVILGQYGYTEAETVLNLTQSCMQQQEEFCTLFNLTANYNEPLLLVNSSQTHLRELVVRSSKIRRIPSDIFILTPQLRSLLISDCGINRLEGKDFQTAQGLTKLLLQGNSFFILPELVFGSLYNLEELYLAQNTLRILHGTAFSKLSKLRHLDLQQNTITTLPAQLFDKLSSLEHLDLSGNKITVIDEHTFANNMQLHTVILSDNKFTVFQARALEHLTHLNLLDISNSAVNMLSLQSVDTFLAQGCGLSMFAIRGSVIKLHASNNHLTAGSMQIGNKLALRDLDLHGNQINSLADLLGMLNLQRLDISKNQITTLSTVTSPLYLPLPSLIYLNLASNLLVNLSANSFLFLAKLNYLDLAFNRLQTLDLNVFDPLVNLEKFYIEGNHIYNMNYEEFYTNHINLREIGFFDNEFELRFTRKMVDFFRDHNILLPVRFVSTATSDAHLASKDNSTAEITRTHLNALMSPRAFPSSINLDARAPSPERKLVEAPGIHPYWTNRDVLVVVILCFVLLILLLQMYQLMHEEPCFSNCCLRRGGRGAVRGRVGGVPNRPQRLNEDDSEE